MRKIDNNCTLATDGNNDDSDNDNGNGGDDDMHCDKPAQLHACM